LIIARKPVLSIMQSLHERVISSSCATMDRRMGTQHLINHRLIVGWCFRIGGWVVGLPSLVALAFVLVNLFSPTPAPDNSAYLDVGTYGIAGLLANGAHAVGNAFAWLGNVARWIAKAIAVALAAILLFALGLSVTGRGVLRHSSSARVLAVVLAFGFLLVWAVALFGLARSAVALPTAGIAVSLYALWVLGWRYT